MDLLLTLWSILSQALLVWVKSHPMTAWAILLAEVIDSAIASKLKMPTETSSAAYQALFIVTHALAINQERVKAAWNMIHGNGAAAQVQGLTDKLKDSAETLKKAESVKP